MSKKDNIIVGKSGEERALKYLKKNRYKILETNYKNTIGEIDIICRKRKTLVFVEVKTRVGDFFGRPSEAVNVSKQNKIRSVAMGYLKHKKKIDSLVRFDVIEVLESDINHIENCF